LLYVTKDVSGTDGGFNVIYNWTSPIVQPNQFADGTNTTVLLFHFDNRSEFGEATETTSAGDNYTFDFSGNGNNGTFLNGATINFTDSKFGGAAEFDGVDDYIDGGDYLNGLTSLTVSVWIKSDVIDTNNGFIKGHITDTSDGMVSLRYDSVGSGGGENNVIKVGFGGLSSATASQLESSANVQTTDWQHVVATWNGGEIPHLFINGIEDTPSFTSSNGDSIISDTLRIGRSITTTTYWNGSIDEVAIWNRSLSSEEILDLYRLKSGKYFWKVNVSDGTDTVENKTFEFTLDATLPTINGSLNKSLTNIVLNDVINATFNMTDDVNSINGTIVINNTGINRYFNFSFVDYVTGNSQEMSQNFTISEAPGTVINITGIAIDNVSNRKQNETIFTVADGVLPIINGTLNKSLNIIYQGDVINATFNVSDETGLSFGQVIINDTGFNRIFNFSLSGTSDTFSQNFSLSCNGCVVNITGRVNDTNNNFAQNETIFTVINNFNFTRLVDQDGVRSEFGFARGLINRTLFNTSVNAIELDGTAKNGTYLSQIFDLTSPRVFQNISWIEEVPYQREIGRADGRDGNTPLWVVDNVSGGINTSGLVLLMHFNNESQYGEATETTSDGDNYSVDFSVDVNSERTGARNNGTFLNGATINKTNYVFGGGAAEFDGVDDYIQTTSEELKTANNFTISTWFKADDTNPSHHIIWQGEGDENGWGNSCDGTHHEMHLSIGGVEGPSTIIGDVLSFHIGDCEEAESSDTIYIETPFTDTTNWNHVLVTVEAMSSSPRAEMFIDGVSVGSDTGTTTRTSRTTWDTDLRMGRPGASQRFFGGQLDEVAIWNRTLSSDEILNLYKRGALRLNLSVRSCDDAACDTETFTDFSNSTKSDISSLTNNKFIQYRANFDSDNITVTPQLYNVTIHHSADTSLPIVNATLNKSLTSIKIFDVINLSANASDETGLSFGQIIVNDTGFVRIFNFSLSGTSDTFSQNITITKSGVVINFTARVNDTSNNFATNDTIVAVVSLIVGMSLNDTSVVANTNDPVAVSGHINLSNGTNVSKNLVNLFIDDGRLYLNFSKTETNGTGWELGTAINVTINADNITLNRNGSGQYPNQTGNFTSQVIDTRTGSNFTFISWVTEVPYQTEIGRAVGDGNSASDEDGFINTSGLVLLMHFNNESSFGEATETTSDGDNYSLDFSVDVNTERTGARNNGTFLNGATINKTDYIFGGGAAEFGGSNDFVNLASKNGFSTGSGAAWTLEAWVKPDVVDSATHFIISYGDGTADNSPHLIIVSSNVWRVSTWGSGNNLDGSTPVANRWYYVVGTADGTNLRLYVNGVLDAGPKSVTNNPVTTRARIGASPKSPPTLFWDGLIDEVAIWNRSLSSDEILKLYKRGVLRLNLSVKSCDDVSCSGEGFSEVLTNASGIKLNETITPINRYFQYKAVLNTEDVNYTPVLYNVTINYTTLATDSFGNYNFTFNAPSTAATYTIKVNTTFDGIDGENSVDLTVITSCSCPASGDFEVTDNEVCEISTTCDVRPNAFRVLDGKMRIIGSGAIRADGCFIKDEQSLYVEDGAGLFCG